MEKLVEKIKKLRESSKKRNFVQSFDLIINLKEFDTKKPENKINEEVVLPHGRGPVEVVVFSDTLKDIGCTVLTSKDVENLSKNKRAAKKLANKTDFFLSEPAMMAIVGKHLGQILAPRQKMPKVIVGDPRKLVEQLKRSTKIKIKDAPVIQCIVGKQNMKDEEIAENITAVLKHLEHRLQKGKKNIGKVLLKLSMSKPLELEV